MSFQIQADPSAHLRRVLPDYDAISEAPREFASDVAKQLESQKRYKAIDRNGNVFICANPHIHRWGYYENGKPFLINHERRFLGHISELLKPSSKRRDSTEQEQRLHHEPVF